MHVACHPFRNASNTYDPHLPSFQQQFTKNLHSNMLSDSVLKTTIFVCSAVISLVSFSSALRVACSHRLAGIKQCFDLPTIMLALPIATCIAATALAACDFVAYSLHVHGLTMSIIVTFDWVRLAYGFLATADKATIIVTCTRMAHRGWKNPHQSQLLPRCSF
jgi:hypothetical protein